MEGELLYIDASTSEIGKATKNLLCLNFTIKNCDPTKYQLQLSIQDSPNEPLKTIGYSAAQSPDKTNSVFVNVSFLSSKDCSFDDNI